MINKTLIELVLKGLNGGTWEWDIRTGEEIWSKQFYTVLGYEVGEIEATYSTFIDYLVAPHQRDYVSEKVKAHLERGETYDIEILMRMKTGDYQWFRSIGNALFSDDKVPYYMVGTIINIHEKKIEEIENKHFTMLLEEVGDMARIGAWEVEIGSDSPKWSDEVYRIHEVEIGQEIKLEEAFKFFKPESQARLMQAYQLSLEQKLEYDLKLELTTAKGNDIWVRSICKPILNDKGEIIILRGSFQDITVEVNRQKFAEKRQNLLADQNNRLLNFAHIISHNLRSHSGNLQLMSSILLEENFTKDEEKEIIENIAKISSDLTTTLEHLNEIVQVQTKVDHLFENINFHDLVEKVNSTLYAKIKESEATINEELDIPSIVYVPAYIESIFLNLISNGIKYKHPERKPIITIRSFMDEDDRVNLHFSDNGLGIDLERHRKKVFGLYKTFHKHEDSRGVGLFLTKNQIESLNGSIDVESTPNQGTTFKIVL